MIEVIYEDNVLKPLRPIEGLRRSERTWILLCPQPDKEALHELVGTLTRKEAEEMQKLIRESKIGNVFYLRGGLEGYGKFLQRQALLLQTKESRKVVKKCINCP